MRQEHSVRHSTAYGTLGDDEFEISSWVSYTTLTLYVAPSFTIQGSTFFIRPNRRKNIIIAMSSIHVEKKVLLASSFRLV